MHIPAGATPEGRAVGGHRDRRGGHLRADRLGGARRHRHDRRDHAAGPRAGIGGLREKSVAAHRGRIKHVVIPKANAREVEELPADVREGITFHPVATMDEVLALAFRARPRPAESVVDVVAAGRRFPLRRRTDGGHRRRPADRQTLEFLGGMASAGGWRPESTLPEVAFAGRSNVGKSSLLNTLLRRRAAARVSKTPGRTREINFFRVNSTFILVDLPGYGYARVAKERRAEWRPLIEGYLKSTARLRGLVLLLDARRDPTDDDHAMLSFLADAGTPVLVAITKMDKFGKDAGEERVKAIALALELDGDQVVPVSAHTGMGRDELATAVMELLSSPDEQVNRDA